MKNVCKSTGTRFGQACPTFSKGLNVMAEGINRPTLTCAAALLAGAILLASPAKAQAGDMFQGCNIPTPIMIELNATKDSFTLLPKIKPHENLFLAAPISVSGGGVSPALVAAATPTFDGGKSNLFLGLRSGLDRFRPKVVAAFTRLFAGGTREASVLTVTDPASGEIRGEAVVGSDIPSVPGLRLGAGFEGIGSGAARFTIPFQIKKGNTIFRGSASVDSEGRVSGEFGARILFP